jgi:predicted MFS family arabinose efflux permease
MVRFRTGQTVDHVRRVAHGLASGGRGWILAAVAAGWLLSLGTRLVFPALLPHITLAYGLTNVTAGAVITVIGITVATMQFPSGVVADRVGERAVLVGGLCLAATGLTVVALVPPFVAFLAGVVLFGLGMGAYGSPRVMVLSNVYPERDGTAIGITFSAGHVGTSVLPFVAGLVALSFGWRAGFLSVVPLFLLVALGLSRVLPRRTRPARSSDDRPTGAVGRQVLSVVARPRVLLLFAVLSLWAFTFVGITTFLPTYLVSVKRLSPPAAATVFSLLFLSGLFFQAGGGSAADRVGYRRVLVPLAAFSVLPLVLLPVVDGAVALGVVAALLGARLGLMPVTNAYLIATIPDEVQGASYGLLRSFQQYVGSTGALFVGFFADAALLDEAFLVMAALTVVMTGLYVVLPKQWAT